MIGESRWYDRSSTPTEWLAMPFPYLLRHDQNRRVLTQTNNKPHVRGEDAGRTSILVMFMGFLAAHSSQNPTNITLLGHEITAKPDACEGSTQSPT